MLEAEQHEANAFVTLTYSDDFLPEDGSLQPGDARNFLKRVRKRVAPSRIRFYLVGEYGDQSWRPHYHAALFGVPACAYGKSRYSSRLINCCYWCDFIRDTWGLGHTYSGMLVPETAQYLCGYVTKKMTAADDPRLEGRHPEFARMSLKPGIGADAMWDLASEIMLYGLEDKLVDVPNTLQHGMRKMPLGRYLRRLCRERIGRDGKIPQAAYDELQAEMRPLLIAARNSSENPSVKAAVIARDLGKVHQVEGRAKLFKQRRNGL